MLKRFALLFTLLFAAPVAATAQDFADFTEESFNEALDSGQPIVVNFYETWCPRCTTQRRNLNALLLSDEAYEDVIVLEAVYSDHREFAATLGIRTRTSLALIVDRELVAIEVGGTSQARVQALLDAES